ncbi:CaiB/BaiF CoA transferase family protein [Actinomadura rugatobispora]|uniref:CaiB/BaiF CoA transferase family protein n=1 Tax=Actinomadura rugatobispora TaxID=1994 RepID=A0ABW1AB70_9ACTN
MGPLDGIRVLDFTSTFLGPYCTMMMAQLGADVIKVEPRHGDVVRGVGAARNPGMSATYMTVNAGKRGIVLDLKSPEGRRILDRMAAGADLVIHNMRQETAVSLGISHRRLREVNPRIIVVEAFGFAPDGPDAGRPAYDDVIQAACGLADLESRRQGRPQYVTTILADKVCALVAMYAAMAALFERERTGEGQNVVVPMYESMVSFLLHEQLAGEAFVPALGPATYPRTTSRFRRPYRTKDGHIGVILYTDGHWRSFFESIGRPELAGDPRYRDIGARTRNIDELYSLVETELAAGTTGHWMRRFRELDCPAIEVRTVDDLIADPYLNEAGVIVEQDHPSEGRVRNLGMPARFSLHSRAPGSLRHAPRLGEHTREVLAEFGYSPEQVAAWAERGVVGAEPRATG